MITAILALMLSAEPRFLGGATPTPLTVPGPTDPEPTIQACSTRTLRLSSKCVFDARPIKPATNEAQKHQAKENLELAITVGKGLCEERHATSAAEAGEKKKRVAACAESVQRTTLECSLSGVEALLDGEGRFSTRARACYEALAAALQSSEVPAVPRASPAESGEQAPPRQPTKI